MLLTKHSLSASSFAREIFSSFIFKDLDPEIHSRQNTRRINFLLNPPTGFWHTWCLLQFRIDGWQGASIYDSCFWNQLKISPSNNYRHKLIGTRIYNPFMRIDRWRGIITHSGRDVTTCLQSGVSSKRPDSSVFWMEGRGKGRIATLGFYHHRVGRWIEVQRGCFRTKARWYLWCMGCTISNPTCLGFLM